MEIHEPLELYADTFESEHLSLVEQTFDSLAEASKVDIDANRQTVTHLYATEKELKGNKTTNFWWQALRAVLILASAGCAFMAYYAQNWVWLLGTAAPWPVIIFVLNGIIRDSNAVIDDLESRRNQLRNDAWRQMMPLNQSHDWYQAHRLVMQTLPDIQFEHIFTSQRMAELQSSFGWSDRWGINKSVTCVQSALLFGSPIVLAQYVYHWMGSKQYSGSLRITWIEQVKDSNGNWKTETRSETLNAYVTKPFPEYRYSGEVIHGHDLVPHLSFSRKPNGAANKGLLGKLALGWNKSAIKGKARKTKGGFVPLENQDFDATFNAVDRSDETAFRVMFTALAQRQMLLLLQDKEVGYGDDFAYSKSGMVTRIEPSHLTGIDLSCNPALLQHYDFDAARAMFVNYHMNFFKGMYFAIAPLLAIPEYQIGCAYRATDTSGSGPATWELEAVANHHGDATFAHPQCVTKSILKTQHIINADGVVAAEVTAYGYMGIPRTDYVSVKGGDGHYHEVAVHWTEYIDVHQSSSMTVVDTHDSVLGNSWQAILAAQGISADSATVYKSLRSVVGG
jgi:hypothetical protein